MKHLFLLAFACVLVPGMLNAQVARSTGKAVGEFGAGVGEAVGEGVTRGMSGLQSQWITIPPRSKDECLSETGGVVNPVFVRCRNGRQESVRYDANGVKIVLRERPIPMQ